MATGVSGLPFTLHVDGFEFIETGCSVGKWRNAIGIRQGIAEGQSCRLSVTEVLQISCDGGGHARPRQNRGRDMFRCLRSGTFCRISERKTGVRFSWKCSKPFGGTTVILATLPVSSMIAGGPRHAIRPILPRR